MDWLRATAAELGQGIGRGEIDPVELAEAHLAAIDAHRFGPRIYARTTPDRALAEAAAARARAKSGFRRGPLDGVPVSWKDLFDTAGVATEAGSALLAGRVPEKDAAVLANATQAGLVCLGKTHTTELAFSGLGLNPVTASPPNINDHDAASGGSSSGAAASVAFGLAAAGVGSDTGGSVRTPSVWNDLVGLKTTHGLLSLEGVVPLCESFDTVGPLCRSVPDAALMLGALGGQTAPDLGGATLEGARIGVLTTLVQDDLHDAPRKGFEPALDRMTAAGATLETFRAPYIPDLFALAAALYSTEAYAEWQDEIEAAPEKMFAPVLGRFRIGANVSAVEYIRARQTMMRLRREWAAQVAAYDAVVLPTVPILPPNQAELFADEALFMQVNLFAQRNTRLGNMLGVCALTLPTGVPSTGVMIFAPPFAEAQLLRLGAAVERALA